MANVLYPRLIKRVRAVLIDSVLVPVTVFGTLILGDALGVSHPFAKAMLIAAPIFVLEPAFVAITGGTVGHHLMKIRVTRLDGAGKINILAATVRFIVKMLLGWMSFIFVLTTIKHQAVHDLIARSLVVHRDASGLPSYEVLPERKSDTEGYVLPPVWRRVVIIIGYCILLIVALSVLTAVVSSDACLQLNRCTTSDKLFEIALSVVWLVTTGWIVVRGWSGKLYGCRRCPIWTSTAC